MFLLDATSWEMFANELIQICIIPLLGTITAFLVMWIKSKTKEIQTKTDSEFVQSCLSILETTVINAVIATNQTYVEALKKENAFTIEAQKEAFNKTYEAVIASLTEDTKKGIMTMTNDLNAYIVELIEAQVNNQKKGE